MLFLMACRACRCILVLSLVSEPPLCKYSLNFRMGAANPLPVSLWPLSHISWHMKIIWNSNFIANKVLLEHGRTHSFTCCPGCFHTPLARLRTWKKDHLVHNASDIYSGTFPRTFADLCFRMLIPWTITLFTIHCCHSCMTQPNHWGR